MRLESDSIVGHYRIIEEIASGGMGKVYLAEDTILYRKVAIKILSNELAQNQVFKKQFMLEAQAAASVDHPNIVTIFDVSEIAGNPYIVMEYVDGKSIKSLVESKEISVHEATAIIRQICSALRETHMAGLLHRDIKSNNILIDKNNNVKVLDFGLAKKTDTIEPNTFSAFSGTVLFMSPEQIRGEELTEASDLFSLGVISYQMLSGEYPFKGDYEAAIKFSIENETPKDIREFSPEIDEKLADVIMKMLEKEISNRYSSANDVICDLESVSASHKNIWSMNIGNKAAFFFGTIVIAIFFTYLYHVMWGSQSENEFGTQEIMLAVLPFENLGTPNDEYFSDGITDALTHGLAKLKNIGVISRQSASKYKGSELGLKEIGNQLGVDYILSGTIHWDKTKNDSVRIYTSLIHVTNDKYIWSDSYDGRLSQLFGLQTTILEKVAYALKIIYSESDLVVLKEIPTSNLNAYDFYLKGNQLFNRSWKKSDIEMALLMYNNAIALDSGFASAYAMASRCYSSLYWEYYEHSLENCNLAKSSANKALSLNNNFAVGYLAMGYCFYHCEQNFDKALQLFNEGLTFSNNNGDLHNAVAAVQRRQGKFVESNISFKRSLKLDPRSHLKALDIGFTSAILHQYDSADFYAKKSIGLNKDYSLAHIFKAWLPILSQSDIQEAENLLEQSLKQTDLTSSKYYWWLLRIIGDQTKLNFTQITPGTDSIAYYLFMVQRNRLKENSSDEKLYADSALQILKKKLADFPDDARYNSSIGLAYASLGEQEKSLEFGEKALELISKSKDAFDAPFLAMNCAEIFIILKDYDSAIEILKYLVSNPGLVSKSYIQIDPLWKSLLENESFKEFLVQDQ